MYLIKASVGFGSALLSIRASATSRISAKRLDAGRALAKEQGCVLESFFMTMGSFDNVAVD